MSLHARALWILSMEGSLYLEQIFNIIMEKVKQGLSSCPIDYEVSNTMLRISYSKLVVKALKWFCISYLSSLRIPP
jgi:hypothetical protein